MRTCDSARLTHPFWAFIKIRAVIQRDVLTGGAALLLLMYLLLWVITWWTDYVRHTGELMKKEDEAFDV